LVVPTQIGALKPASNLLALKGDYVVLNNITQIFPSRDGGPEVNALGPLNFTLKEGEFFSVIGPSGCGKSTLLEIIAGLAEPTTGEVSIGSEPVRGGVPAKVGVVFQEDASFPWLTVWKNILFGLKRQGVSQKIAFERAEWALDLTGLRGFRDAFPAQLSGGMRQRVCIARTLVMEPKLILLDEPFGALDQQTRLLMGDEVLNLWRATGATIMLITHSLDEAAMLSDRVGVMSARPGKFLEIIETEWDRDRDGSVASTEKFGNLTAHLWSRLRRESIEARHQLGDHA
jgi:NitT/TauT family transport system ATP-binding protein